MPQIITRHHKSSWWPSWLRRETVIVYKSNLEIGCSTHPQEIFLENFSEDFFLLRSIQHDDTINDPGRLLCVFYALYY